MWKIAWFHRNFADIFEATFAEKQLVKKWPILWAYFARNWSVLRWFDSRLLFFLTEIIISYFNNKVFEKWASGKAYHIMTSAQFFAIWFIPGSFGKSFACLLTCIWQDFYGISQLHDRAKYHKPCFLEIYNARFGSWVFVLRVIHLINLTSQKPYVTELKWMWPVIVSRESLKIILSPVLLPTFCSMFWYHNYMQCWTQQ